MCEIGNSRCLLSAPPHLSFLYSERVRFYLPLLAFSPSSGKGTCDNAAEHGHLDVLVWARSNGCEWGGATTCAAAADRGHLHVLRWLREKGCPWNFETIAIAEMEGHMEIAAWAKENGCPEYPSDDPLDGLFGSPLDDY